MVGVKNSLSDSIKKSFISGEFSTSQKQAAIKLRKRQINDKSRTCAQFLC